MPSEEVGDELLTEKQVATKYKISKKSLQRWRWAGTGPRYLKISAAVRYRQTDLDAFVRVVEPARNTGEAA